MDSIFFTGLMGSLILVSGAAWPEAKDLMHPAKSMKNWLFAIGGFIMLLYAVLGYQQGGPIFFVILEILVVGASMLMMLNTPDKVDAPLIGLSGLGLIIWSLYLFEGFNTVIFIFGLCGIGLGYAFQMGTLRRSITLTIGSALIAVFSYIEMSWLFFWLNVFFAIFSAYYIYKGLAQHAARHRRGFTLIELMIVVSVVLILAASAMGAAGGIMRGLRFTNTFNKMVLLVQRARSLAVTGKDASVTEYQIHFSRASQTATFKTNPGNFVLDATLSQINKQGLYFYSPANCNVMTVTFKNGDGKASLKCGAVAADQLTIGLRECSNALCQTVKREKTFSIHKAAGVPQVQ